MPPSPTAHQQLKLLVVVQSSGGDLLNLKNQISTQKVFVEQNHNPKVFIILKKKLHTKQHLLTLREEKWQSGQTLAKFGYHKSLKNTVTKFWVVLYELLGPQFTSSGDRNTAETAFRKASVVLSILLNLCLHFPELCRCQPTSVGLTYELQHEETAACLPRKLCSWLFWTPILTDVLAHRAKVAVAPVMNVVFHLSISTELVLLASHR